MQFISFRSEEGQNQAPQKERDQSLAQVVIGREGALVGGGGRNRTMILDRTLKESSIFKGSQELLVHNSPLFLRALSLLSLAVLLAVIDRRSDLCGGPEATLVLTATGTPTTRSLSVDH